MAGYSSVAAGFIQRGAATIAGMAVHGWVQLCGCCIINLLTL